MRKLILALASFILLLTLSACEDYVVNVDDPINLTPDEQLSSPEQVDFLLTGLRGRFAETHDELTVSAGGLSDEQVFDRDLPQATFPSYDRMERGDFQLDDGTINNELGELRFYADDLVRRVNEEVEFTPETEDIETAALFWGTFLGGVARSWYASYMGLNPNEGGGVIDDGPFIPSDEMYQQALDKMEESKAHASNYQERVVNSTMARTNLYRGDYAAARNIVENEEVLRTTDEPFTSDHSVESTNAWYFAAGVGRIQWRVHERFSEYVEEDPDEEARIPLSPVEGRSGTTHYRQDVYPERSSPIDFISWQEVYLIRAELALRDGDPATARDMINEVRTSHNLDPYGEGVEIDMDVLIEERDKELFTRGHRLVDQRRFGLWHLGDDRWRYFPISEQERNNNPNL